MADRFVQSPFSANEKRNIFFHENIWRCHTCRKPIVKARINTYDFSNFHRSLIWTRPRNQHAPHVAPVAPGGHAPVAPGCHAPVAPGGHGLAEPGCHGPAAPGGHAPHGPVTRAKFNATVNQLTNRINNIENNLNNLTNRVNNMDNNITNLVNTMNNFIARVGH